MSIQEIIEKITQEILNPIIYLLFAAATIMFVVGIIKYILSASPQQVDQGKKTMLYGIIGLFVMASALGIVKILCNFFETGC